MSKIGSDLNKNNSNDFKDNCKYYSTLIENLNTLSKYE